MLTIDENGHIFIWRYERKFLDANGMFTPAYKYRFSLNYLRMVCKKKRILKTNKQTENIDEMYIDAMDYRHQASTDGHYKLIIPSIKPPKEDEMYLNEVTFNSKKDYMKTETGAYVREEDRAKLGGFRQSKDRQIIAIELVKNHLFGSEDFKTIEIVLFKATLSRD